MTAVIKELWTYPLKSAAGVRLDEAELTPLGFELDRCFMLVDSNNGFVSQRQFPEMALLKLVILPDSLLVSYPSASTFEIELNSRPFSHPFDVSMHTKNGKLEYMQVIDIGGQAASKWFTDVLNAGSKGPLRLVKLDPDFDRYVESNFLNGRIETTNLADGYPYLVTEEADYNLVNQRLKLAGIDATFDIPRTRPNIVVSGLSEWSLLHGGSLDVAGNQLEIVKPCGRCIIIRTNQESAKRDIDKELITEILPQINAEMGLSGAFFGGNAILVKNQSGLIRVNDQVDFA